MSLKKILLVTTSIFLLISCSQNNKEAALENCADDKFINHKDPSFDKKFGSYVGLVVSNWGKDTIGNKLLAQSKEIHKAINKSQKKFNGVVPKKISDDWKAGRERAKSRAYSAHERFGRVAFSIVPKTNIKKKVANEFYAEYLIICEKLYNETPSSFILKWNNR